MVNSDSTQVKTDQSAVDSAQALQTSAEARLSDYIVASQAAATSAFDFAVKNAQQAVNEQQAVVTAQANATAAQQKVANAKAAALKALETYNNYKNDNGGPTIQVPSDIAQQYENYLNSNRHNSAQIKSDCANGLAMNGADPTKGLMTAIWTSTDGGKTWKGSLKTNYQVSAQDKSETVDPRNLTAAQQTEITKFVAQIINGFRASFQSTAEGAAHSYGMVKVSPYATELGNQVINAAYNTSGWNKSNNSTGSPHNESGMVAAANAAGLKTGFVGENLSTGMLLDPAGIKLKQSMSMADVKDSIYASILAMIYQDVETNDGDKLHYGFGGHTEAFLNDPKGMNGISYDDNGNQYMTVTIDKDGWVHYMMMVNLAKQ